MKKILSCLLALALTAALAAPMASAADYADIPEGSALAGEVRKAVEYGLMNKVINRAKDSENVQD